MKLQPPEPIGIESAKFGPKKVTMVTMQLINHDVFIANVSLKLKT